MKHQIDINGMSCGHCKARVEGALGSLEGVQSYEVSLAGKHAIVEFDENAVSLDKIEQTIEDLGFDVAY